MITRAGFPAKQKLEPVRHSYLGRIISIVQIAAGCQEVPTSNNAVSCDILGHDAASTNCAAFANFHPCKASGAARLDHDA